MFVTGQTSPIMKHRLLFVFLIIGSVSFAQSRHRLQKEIQAYKDSVVLTATYPISQESLQTLIETYLHSDGWKLNPSTQRFSKVVKSINRRREPRTVYRSGVSRVSLLVNCSHKRSLETQVYSENGFSNFQLEATSSKGYGYVSSGCPVEQASLWSEPVEMALKRFLYVQVYGDWVEFPLRLEKTISAFNESRSEKRKLIAGIDY